jgi:hypothetical protein
LFSFSEEKAKNCITILQQFHATFLSGNVHRWSQRMWNVTSKVTRCLSHGNGKDTTLHVHRPDKSDWGYSVPVATSSYHVPGIIVFFFMCLFVIFLGSFKLNSLVAKTHSCNEFCSLILFINYLPSHTKMVARLINFNQLCTFNWGISWPKFPLLKV